MWIYICGLVIYKTGGFAVPCFFKQQIPQTLKEWGFAKKKECVNYNKLLILMYLINK